jgi:hypothetical protein
MRYTLKQGYVRKLKLFVREKIKILDEAEINLETVDKSGMLHPRKINRNAHIVKRHRAYHEATSRKNITQKSQIKKTPANQLPGTVGASLDGADDLLIPYKKVSFLPAYFYKVFIKKKKVEEAPAKGKRPGAPAKPDPKNPKGKPGAPEA